MINQNDDPLIAEIEKRMAAIDKIQEEQPTYSSEWYESNVARNTCSAIIDLVKQDRARQQEEKEKMIADVDALLGEHRKPFRDTYDYGVYEALQIIQGKEQKEEREARKE